MRIRFWGVRGSVPWATTGSIEFGCNTPCIEIEDEQTGHLLVLDAGSGIVGLGEALTGEPRPVSILLTHYHSDHLQGLPFFGPLFRPGWAPTIWAPALVGSVEAVFESPFFPMPYQRLPTPPPIHVVQPADLRIGPFEVQVRPLTHPGGAYAYRVRGADGDFVYATDHEFGDEAVDRALGAFIEGARAVVLDAHFTPDELPAHKGWGHGDWAQCARFAAAHGAGQLWLFHHKPGRTDEELKRLEREAQRIFTETRVAAEGKTFTV